MKIYEYAPIAIFSYKRLDTLKELISSLENNDEFKDSDLFVFVDGPKDSFEEKQINKEIVHYVSSIKGCKTLKIISSSENKGLAKSIIEGVSKIIREYDKIIVVEDDLVLSNQFLKYMNEALDFYKNDQRIWSIGGYSPNILPKKEKVYFTTRTDSWGWACWKDRWEKVDWDVKDFDNFIQNKSLVKKFNKGGNDLTKMLVLQQENKIHSWSIRFDYASYKNNGYNVHPFKSLVENNGFGNNGTNCISKTSKYDVELINDYCPKLTKFKRNYYIEKRMYLFYSQTIYNRILSFISKLLKTIRKKEN